MKTPPLKISVCIPLLNEKENVRAVLQRVSAVLSGLPGGPHEILLVDDGSTDGTTEEIQAYALPPAWGKITILKLSRNFGHQAALTAALDHVSGDAAFIIDGDLQDRPEELPRFIAKMSEGYDVVYGVRRARKEGWLLRTCYHSFYRILNTFADLPVPEDSGDFGLISARVVRELREAPERNRFLRGIRAWIGYRQAPLEVERDARHAGKTKYSVRKLLRLAADGIFSFSTTPLRIATAVGALTILGGFGFGIYAAYVRLIQEKSPEGFTALTSLLILFSGTQLLFLGLVGEYIGRIYQEVKHRKNYILDQVWSTDQKKSH